MNRRQFLRASSMIAALPISGCIAKPFPVRFPNASSIPAIPAGPGDTLVNDVHSQLNATRVDAIVKPETVRDLQAAIRNAVAAGKSVCVAGGRHAMGGQQFGEASVLIDTRALNRVLHFDMDRGVISVEAGIQWPELVDSMTRLMAGQPKQWGIYQKQTGADRLSLGGALACNAHGRGLNLKPIIDQVEAFDIAGPDAEVVTVSRREHPDFFRLAIGGYGLFGIITRVELRLRPRVKVRRVVEIGETATIMHRLEGRIGDGYLYGDYQFATDSNRDSFLDRGVFACYQPVPDETPLTANPTHLSPEDWARLTFYSHKYKRRAFDVYTTRYLQSSGQIYWADSQLAASYVDNYHVDLDKALHAKVQATEMLTELYVQRSNLAAFMHDASAALRQRKANVIYGTLRLIEKDDESYLAWARDRYACIVFNLHVEHTPAAIDRAAGAFQSLIDLAIKHGGSYYLTYHRWARQDQVETCYPQMREFIALKREHDPGEVFQSNWYRHYRAMFASSERGPRT